MLTPDAQREEAVNVRLADLLNETGAYARAETIVRSDRRKKFPDVRVEWAGLHTVIEEKHIEPLCAAVAAVVLGDGIRGPKVREEVVSILSTRF